VSLPMVNDDYLDALREFIDFINRQVGVYMDAMAGFAGNKVRMELQTARIRRRSAPQIQSDGSSIVASSSLEDPSRPDVILSRIYRAQDYVADNSEGGFNEQQHTRAIIVFIFAYWDEEIRPRLPRAKSFSSPNDIRVDSLGDLRLLRRAIIHNKGILSTKSHEKMKVMQDMFTPNAEISIPRDNMHRLFVGIKQGIGQRIVDHIGARPGAPDVGQIKDVSIKRI
jgi:hypothetical protein